MSEWIKVSEALPEPLIEVLIYIWKTHFYGFMYEDKKHFKATCLEYYCDDEVNLSIDEDSFYWQELPRPPGDE